MRPRLLVSSLLALLAVAGACGAGSDERGGTKTPPPPPGQIYHAAYPDFGGWEDEVTAERIGDFEDLVGEPLVWAMFSNNWWRPDPGIVFPSEHVGIAADRGLIPYIRMMPRNVDETLPDPDYSMLAFAEGAFDDELAAWARDARAYGDPLMVEFGTEVNGSWFPWNGVWNGAGELDGPGRFRDAYRHIVDLFRAEGAINITWVFHVNAISVPYEPWNSITAYYPGDDYIDWIGVSVYGAQESGDEWRTFEEVLGESWDEILALSNAGKPIAVMEWGVIEGAAGEDKARWITDAFSVLGPDGDYPEITAISYWHENFDGADLRLDSSPDALEAYRAGLSTLDLASYEK